MHVVQKSSARIKADSIREDRCKGFIAVLEEPKLLVNIASALRNVSAFGVEKLYVVDPQKQLDGDWYRLRENQQLLKLSVSASKWTFVKRFDSTDECFDHLESIHYRSIVTSPHVKGKANIDLTDGDFTKFKRLAVWFGNESRGISDRAVERSELCVNIPMFGMVESLNLGTCTGIVLHHIATQRRAFTRARQTRMELMDHDSVQSRAG